MSKLRKIQLPRLTPQTEIQHDGLLSHKMDAEIVRKYDIRGEIDKNLSDVDAYFIGLSFAQDFPGSRITVGYDGRHSSPLLEKSLVAGLVDGGAQVTRIGLGPTPMLYYSVHYLDADAGIMITGSHNAPLYNGFKFTLKDRPYFGKDLQRLATNAACGLCLKRGGTAAYKDIRKEYVSRLHRTFREHNPVSVAWDPGNGAAGEIIQDLVSLLPGTHLVINGDIDGDFPNHHPDPTVPANMEQLRNVVLKNKFDLGVGFDGDGDRLGVVNSQGDIIWADKLLTLFSEDILQRHPEATFIADVKTSQTYFDHISQLGGNPIMWSTGHSLIKMKMIETGALLAGEMSGHIFFADTYYGYDDAIYAAIRLLNLASASSKSFDDLCQSLPVAYATPEIRIPCPELSKTDIMNKIRKAAELTDGEILSIDGLRVTNGHGWWLIRPSNTEPVLVARCESPSTEGLTSQIQELTKLLNLPEIKLDIVI